MRKPALQQFPFWNSTRTREAWDWGGATVALRYHRAGAHVNPATIGNPGHLEISSQFQSLNSNEFPYYRSGIYWLPSFQDDRNFYMPSISVTKDRWAFSYQLSYFDLGEEVRTDPSGRRIGTFSSHEQAHTFTAAYRWSDHLSFGAGINIIRSKLVPGGLVIGGSETQVGSSVALDLGVYGQYPYWFNDNIKLTPSAGWSLTDFGSKIKYSERANGDPLPMKMRGGLGLKLELTESVDDIEFLKGKTPFSVAFYQSFEKLMARTDLSGNSMGPFEALFSSWDTYPRDTGPHMVSHPLGEQIDQRGGLEVIVFDMLSFRHGYYNVAEANGGGKRTYFGFGLHYKMVSLDYLDQDIDSESYLQPYDAFWQLSLAFSVDQVQGLFGGANNIN